MSKPSYQEQILDKYYSFEAVKDCFAISRIDDLIFQKSVSAAFNKPVADEIAELKNELEAILKKYPDAVKL